MKRILLCLLFTVTIAKAQNNKFRNHFNPAMPGVVNKSPGKGLLIEQRLQPGFNATNLNGETQRAEYNRILNLQLKVPFVLKPRLTVLGGVSYQKENYQFADAGLDEADPLFATLNSEVLRTTRFSLYATQSLNEKFYLALKADAMYSGDYDNLSGNLSRFATYRGVVALGYKPDKYKEYGFGLMYSQNFRQTLVLPVLYMNRTFNRRWGMELVLPVKLKARYNFSPKSLLLLGTDFESRNYSINTSNETEYIYNFRRAALSFNATYQKNLKGWVWFQAQAGYNMNFRNRIDDVQTGNTVRLRQGNAPFVSVGIFLSPSKKKK